MSSSWSPATKLSVLELQGKFVGCGPRAVFLTKYLCSGGQGAIFRASASPEYALSDDVCAVKVIRRTSLEQRSRIMQEFDIHRSVSSHANIVACRDCFDDGYYIYGAMDLVLGGDLHYAISEKAIFWQDDDLLRDALRQIIDAVTFCHSKQIAHLDLKPENVLCSSDCRHVYLTDFGVATRAVSSRQHNIGTTMYMAPEVLECDPELSHYDTRKADIWSLGCMFVNMIGGQMPWYEARPSDANFATFLVDSKLLRCMLPISLEANDLTRMILERAPSKRISLGLLSQKIGKIRTFFMDAQDIKHASDSVRGVALLAASTKHDWILREVQRSVCSTEDGARTISNTSALEVSEPAHDSRSADSVQSQSTRQRVSSVDVSGDASGHSFFSSSESYADLASLCDDDINDDLEGGAGDDQADGFEDISLLSPLVPFTYPSLDMVAKPHIVRVEVVLPELARDAVSAVSTLAPSTPPDSPFFIVESPLTPSEKLATGGASPKLPHVSDYFS